MDEVDLGQKPKARTTTATAPAPTGASGCGFLIGCCYIWRCSGTNTFLDLAENGLGISVKIDVISVAFVPYR